MDQTTFWLTSTAVLPGLAPRAVTCTGELTRSDIAGLDKTSVEEPRLQVITVLAEILSLVAETVELPTLTQVTIPVAFTESDPLELDVQVAAPVTSLDAVLLRLSLALSCDVAPSPTSMVEPVIFIVGYTKTAGGGTMQVSSAVADSPSLLAITVAVPAARQVAKPVALIESGPIGKVCQATEAVTSSAAAAPEVSDACSCSVCPIAVRFATPVIVSVEGASATVQVIETEFTAASLLAETCAVPAATQVTSPLPLTVSVPAGLTCQVAKAVTSTGAVVPVLSLACNCSVLPTPDIGTAPAMLMTYEGGDTGLAPGLLVAV